MCDTEKLERQIAGQIKGCAPNAYRSAFVGKIVDDLIKERGRNGAEKSISAVIERVKNRIKKMKAEGQDVRGQKIFQTWLEAMRAKIRPQWLLQKQLKAIARKQPQPHRQEREIKRPVRPTGRRDQLASATS